MEISNPLTTQPKKVLTKAKLLTAFFVQLNEAYQITVLLPMVVFMCRDFGVSSKQLGVYTSLLNASFMFCQFLSSYFWGSFSDKHGRKTALLIGLVFSSIGILVLGFATTYWHALIARCICGLLCGNMGVIKAYLADITDSSNRAFAFSIMAISFGFGNILGSTMGGLLIVTHSVDKNDNNYRPTTSILEFSIFHKQFPYLLPLMFGALVAANASIWTMIFVKKESQAIVTQNHKNKHNNNMMPAELHNNNSENMLIHSLENDNSEGKAQSVISLGASSIGYFEANNTASLPLDLHGYGVLTSAEQMYLLSGIRETDMNATDEIRTLSQLFERTQLLNTLFCYMLVAINVMMFREMNPVYWAQALHFNSQYIGYVQAWSGMSLLVFTFYCQPYFLKRFNHRRMAIFNSTIGCIVMLLEPSIFWFTFVSVVSYKWFLLILACAIECILVATVSILFVISMVFINNSVPPTHMGKANGIAQSGASLLRAVGPVITGFIWTNSVDQIQRNKYAVYYAYLPASIGFLVLAVHYRLFIQSKMQFTWEEQREFSKSLIKTDIKKF